MHKKLIKYIERYELIEKCTSYEVVPNGCMIVLINYGTKCEVTISQTFYTLENFQVILLNAYTEAVTMDSPEMLHLIASPLEPIFMEKDILENEIDSYLLKRLTPSKLPFNIMKIIDLLDEQGSNYSIDEILAIANVPRKTLDKMFNLRTGLTFKTYATLREIDK
jgi:hypothetical protein